MTELLNMAVKSAAAAVRVLRSEFKHDAGVIQSVEKDIKTLADLEAQKVIIELLQPTGIPILAEEDGQQASFGKGRVWLIDPLDGTFNYDRGFPVAAVSVALWEDNKPLLGVVHDLFCDEVYSATVDGGAWLGTERLRVSSVNRKEDAALATGFPSGRSYASDSLLQFIESIQAYKKIRMLGSAAMMLAQVAAGRFDAYEEEDIYIWDVAAGLALVQAAGGQFQMEAGSGEYQFRVRASNGNLH